MSKVVNSTKLMKVPGMIRKKSPRPFVDHISKDKISGTTNITLDSDVLE